MVFAPSDSASDWPALFNRAVQEALEKHKSGALTTTCDATGYVTFNHGGTAAPKSVILNGRNYGHYPYLISISATTVTVRFLSRSNSTPLATATSVAFDWACDFN